MTHSLRRAHLAAAVVHAEVDAILVTDLVNVRYLSGFTGSAGALLVFGDGRPAVLGTDGRYRTQAAQQAPDLEVAIARSAAAALTENAGRCGVRRLGFESGVMTVDGLDALSSSVGAPEFIRTPGLVERLREVKDTEEVAVLRRACAAADAALHSLIADGGVRPGRSERQVTRDLESRMLDHGADAASFETIVATGANSAIPHHRPTDAVLTAGDFVKIDFGALVCGYHSDMTRTFVLGPCSRWQSDVYQLVAEAQRAGRDALRPGADLCAVDAAARQVIVTADHGEHFGHGLGHGVGLRIHEAPGINSTATGTLLAGAVATVEPGVYLPDRGGVRIEDTLVVADTASQIPELLTRFPKELTVL